MPSSTASAAMLRGCLGEAEGLVGDAHWNAWPCGAVPAPRRPPGRPAPPRSGLRARCTRAAMRASSFSVTAIAPRVCGPAFGKQRVLADHEAFTRIVGAGDLGDIAVIEQRGLHGPLFGSELLIAGARSAVIESRPAGRSVRSIRALVNRLRSPTITTRCSPKRCFSSSICTDSVTGSAVSPSKALTATGQPRPCTSGR